MQIVIIAGGSRGDVQPYAALGKGLKDAGHAVCVLASSDFRELITGQGVEFADMGTGVQEAAQEQFQGLVERGNLLQILSSTARGAEQLALQAAAAGLEASRGADVIIGGLGGLSVGLALSQKLDIKFVQAYLVPFTPTREFPSALVPLPQTPLTRRLNRLSHRMAQQMLWQMFRGADRMARTQVLHMPSAPFWGPFGSGRAEPTLYGFSPHVIPPPRDWDDSVHVTGYWFLDADAGWRPPAGLVDFLNAGQPPVYVGFGSMPSSQPEATMGMILKALAMSGQRGVLSAGWGGLQGQNLPENVFMVGSIPHSWLFSHMAAIVHHGGAGTTAASLRAGVPTIVTPYFGDQPFWGQRVAALGVGPVPIPRKKLTAENLAGAVKQAVTDGSMRDRAARLGSAIRSEDGLACAVDVISRIMK
jgi:sterol 3beta-glucosyltransferase